MDCSTIIVSYDTFALTRDAVATALDAAPGLAHEVIVVDNASPDGSAQKLRRAFAEDPRVTVVARPDNPGFSAANNDGAARATGRALFFLNPDTRVLGEAVATLVAFLDAHPDAGAVGPHVLNPDGSTQPSTVPFGTARELVRHYLALGPGPALPTRPSPVDTVKGCALAVSRTTFEEVGGWDESVFMYAEETELCWALQEAGRVNYFVPSARIIHYGGQSLGDPASFAAHQVAERRNSLAFLRKSRPHLVALNRVLGVVGHGARAAVYRAAAWRRPETPFRQSRRAASSALWRWFLFDYS